MKKKIICIVLAAVLALGAGIGALKRNYRFGSDLYGQATNLSGKLDDLARSIEQTMREFEKTGFDPAGVDTVAIWYFEFSLNEIRYSFGYEDMPILDEARLDYIDRAQKLYDESGIISGNQKLARLLSDERKRNEMIRLKSQLVLARDALLDFYDRYNAMPNWKRYFVSWKGEREALTEKLRIPE